MTENAIATIIVDAAVRIRMAPGPGLFESVYETVLTRELEKKGLRVETQQPVPINYEGTRIEMGFRADLIVNGLEE